MKIILTSTTGNLGSRILPFLLTHNLIPPSDLIISSSTHSNVSPLASTHSIPIITGDYTNPTTLTTSWKSSGAEILFLISYPSPSIDRWLHHRAAIDAAKASGTIKLIVYTSLMFGGETGMKSVAGVQQAHIKTVEYLSQCGLEYVVLREGIYAESWWLYAGWLSPTVAQDANTKKPIEFVIPNDGAVAWVTWDDLAEGTARILAKLAQGEGREWINQSLRLTGMRATKISDVARLLERESGHRAVVKEVGREEALKWHLERAEKEGREKWYVESWVGWFEGLRLGECEVVDPLLREVLGREVRGIEEIAGELFKPR